MSIARLALPGYGPKPDAGFVQCALSAPPAGFRTGQVALTCALQVRGSSEGKAADLSDGGLRNPAYRKVARRGL